MREHTESRPIKSHFKHMKHSYLCIQIYKLHGISIKYKLRNVIFLQAYVQVCTGQV